MILWNWKPLISVGPIKFGQLADSIIQQYDLVKLEPPCKSADWETFEFPNCETRIYVYDSEIESVGCYDNLFYKGIDLLGLSLEEIIPILGKQYEIGEIIDMQAPVDYENLGLQLWMENKIMTGGICSGFIEE